MHPTKCAELLHHLDTDTTPFGDTLHLVIANYLIKVRSYGRPTNNIFQNWLAASKSSAFSQSTPFSNKTFQTLFRALTGHPGVSQKRAWIFRACAPSMSCFNFVSWSSEIVPYPSHPTVAAKSVLAIGDNVGLKFPPLRLPRGPSKK